MLRGAPGEWDARGARVTTALGLDPLVLLYDGRPDAESNWFETTGLARSTGGLLLNSGAPVAVSAEGTGALRYVSAVPLPDAEPGSTSRPPAPTVRTI